MLTKLWDEEKPLNIITIKVIIAAGEAIKEILQKYKTPSIWSRMIIDFILKKEDKLYSEFYHAIVLLSIPGKIFCEAAT